MKIEKMGIGFTYEPKLKRVTYSMKEYVRSKHSFNNGGIDQCYICVYLVSTNMHFYVDDEDELKNFLYLDHKFVKHEEIQERLYYTDCISVESKEKTIVRGIQEGVSRYVITDEKYEALKDEKKTRTIDYIAFHQE